MDDHELMGVQACLYFRGRHLTGLADPAGGRFDAAGDFDRLVPRAGLPLLSQVNPFGDLELDRASMRALIAEIHSLLPAARPGPEQRGLLRLCALARACAATAGSVLVFHGD
jgi:hypothetical protein